jgi:hypothetical protein
VSQSSIVKPAVYWANSTCSAYIKWSLVERSLVRGEKGNIDVIISSSVNHKRELRNDTSINRLKYPSEIYQMAPPAPRNVNNPTALSPTIKYAIPGLLHLTFNEKLQRLLAPLMSYSSCHLPASAVQPSSNPPIPLRFPSIRHPSHLH